MTTTATAIQNKLETILQDVIGTSHVFRSAESASLPSDTTYPVIFIRPLSNSAEETLREDVRVTYRIGIEVRFLPDDTDLDVIMDTYIYDVRKAITGDRCKPFHGIVNHFSANEPGISIGEAQYNFPAVGEKTASVMMIFTFRYLERYV